MKLTINFIAVGFPGLSFRDIFINFVAVGFCSLFLRDFVCHLTNFFAGLTKLLKYSIFVKNEKFEKKKNPFVYIATCTEKIK
jgi:hypothetical protein